MHGRRLTLALLAGACLLAGVLRLRFLHVPLNTDEAGYAEIARLWARGARLYGDVAWVDRPQGLMVLFRAAVESGGDTAVRALAVLGGMLATAGVGAAAWALAGRRAAVAAALLYAVCSPAPHLEGFTANGELLGDAPVALALALGAAWWTRRVGDRALIAAGALAACGPLIKQSAFDGALVLGLLVVLAARRDGPERTLRRLGLLVVGAAIPVAAAVIHALTVGIGDWWWATVGYRTGTESAVSGDTLHRLRLLLESTKPALRDLLPLVVLAIPGLAALRRRRCATPVVAWLGFAFLGFLAGGLYHPHYWVQLIPPLAVAAGCGLAAVLADRRRGWLLAAGAAAVATVVLQAGAWTGSPSDVSRASTADGRILSAIPVGRELARLTTRDERVYVIWANAAAYWHADRTPAYRYLWYRGVELIPGARDDVRALFSGPRPPAAVAVYQDPDALDPTGSVKRALAERYHRVADVDGVPVYRLNG